QLETLLSGARIQRGQLRGRFAGDLDTDDARGRPYELVLELTLRDDVLGGPMSAVTSGARGRVTSAVTHWVELRRQQDAEASTAGQWEGCRGARGLAPRAAPITMAPGAPDQAPCCRLS